MHAQRSLVSGASQVTPLWSCKEHLTGLFTPCQRHESTTSSAIKFGVLPQEAWIRLPLLPVVLLTAIFALWPRMVSLGLVGGCCYPWACYIFIEVIFIHTLFKVLICVICVLNVDKRLWLFTAHQALFSQWMIPCIKDLFVFCLQQAKCNSYIFDTEIQQYLMYESVFAASGTLCKKLVSRSTEQCVPCVCSEELLWETHENLHQLLLGNGI